MHRTILHCLLSSEKIYFIDWIRLFSFLPRATSEKTIRKAAQDVNRSTEEHHDSQSSKLQTEGIMGANQQGSRHILPTPWEAMFTLCNAAIKQTPHQKMCFENTNVKHVLFLWQGSMRRLCLHLTAQEKIQTLWITKKWAVHCKKMSTSNAALLVSVNKRWQSKDAFTLCEKSLENIWYASEANVLKDWMCTLPLIGLLWSNVFPWRQTMNKQHMHATKNE